MKIAIYGDSFADIVNNRRAIAEISWPTLLNKHFEQVDNYARAGTSLYWSMEQFERTHANYDRVIFVVTTAGRWPGVIWSEEMDQPVGLPNYDQAVRERSRLDNIWHYPRLTAATKDRLAQQIKDVEAWYLGLAQIMPFENYVHSLMINRIKLVRRDAIIVPTVPMQNTDLADTVSFTDYADLAVDWFKLRVVKTDLVFGWLSRYYEELNVGCHLTEEANQQVYQAMLTAIELGKWAPKLPKKIVHTRPWEYYYKRL